MSESSLLSGRVNRQTMIWLIIAVLAGTVMETATTSNPVILPWMPLRIGLLVVVLVAVVIGRIQPITAGRLMLAMGLATALLWSTSLTAIPEQVSVEATAYGTIISVFALVVAPLAYRYLWAAGVNVIVLVSAGLRLLPDDGIVLGQTIAILVVHGAAVVTLDQYASRVQVAGDLDPLTHLFNRRPMVDRVTKWLTNDHGGTETSSLVIADLDQFKALNDSAGHEAGDEALRSVAKVLQTSIGPNDLVCRWGGEEFLLFLPGVRSKQATAIAQRLRVQVQSTGVTASFGVAEWAHGDTVSTWVSRADSAMYRAKRGGRDQVQVAPAPPSDRAATEA